MKALRKLKPIAIRHTYFPVPSTDWQGARDLFSFIQDNGVIEGKDCRQFRGGKSSLRERSRSRYTHTLRGERALEIGRNRFLSLAFADRPTRPSLLSSPPLSSPLLSNSSSRSLAEYPCSSSSFCSPTTIPSSRTRNK